MPSASATVTVNGLSTTTCLPAASARVARSKCESLGVETDDQLNVGDRSGPIPTSPAHLDAWPFGVDAIGLRRDDDGQVETWDGGNQRHVKRAPSESVANDRRPYGCHLPALHALEPSGPRALCIIRSDAALRLLGADRGMAPLDDSVLSHSSGRSDVAATIDRRARWGIAIQIVAYLARLARPVLAASAGRVAGGGWAA